MSLHKPTDFQQDSQSHDTPWTPSPFVGNQTRVPYSYTLLLVMLASPNQKKPGGVS